MGPAWGPGGAVRSDACTTSTAYSIGQVCTVQYTFTVFSYSFGAFTSVGNFALAAPIHLGGSCCALLNVFGLSFGDVNGDGNLDVISQSNSIPLGNAEGAVSYSVMLNNGNGTFSAPKLLDASALRNLGASAVAFGDVNRDRKADLVTTYANPEGQNYIAAALGNGDGTFGAFSSLLLINGMTAAIANQLSLCLTKRPFS